MSSSAPTPFTTAAPVIGCARFATWAGDRGYRGLAIQVVTRGITITSSSEGRPDISVQAGERLDSLVDFAAANDLSGIENLAGIPGTTGAAPVQDTGAYGQQISDTLTAVTAWGRHARTLILIPASGCQLDHRTSMFKTTSR